MAKIGPQYFAVTNTVGVGPNGVAVPFLGGPIGVPGIGVTQTYTSQGITVSLTTLPLDCRGAYNKTIQIVGTFSAITNIAIEASVHPYAVATPSFPNIWYVIGNLSTPTWMLVHSGNVRSFRARTVAVSNTDNFDLAYMFDDAG